jgi:serine/threonine protein kinase
VYLARAVGNGGFAREFALKVLHPHLDPLLRTRFLDEARLSSRVRHANVVSTIDVGNQGGLDYLALELIDGVDLRRLMLHRSVPLRPRQAAYIITMIARGVHALHEAVDEHGKAMQAVHRDLSPHNVMIDRHGRAVLIDLGLAKTAERPEVTQVGVLCGRLPYMSPEQAQLLPVDARSDVFSLGSVLFELLVGRLPFGDDDSRATHETLIACETAGLADVLRERNVAEGLVEIVLTCLQREPEHRFASAAELADALEQELAHQGADLAALQHELGEIVSAVSGTMPALQPADLPRRRPRRLWSMLAASALAGGAAVVIAGSLGVRTELVAHDPDDAASLASDEVPRTAVTFATELAMPAPAPAPAPTTMTPLQIVPMPVATPAVVSTIEAPSDDAAPRAATPRRKRARALKPNPYAVPRGDSR